MRDFGNMTWPIFGFDPSNLAYDTWGHCKQWVHTEAMLCHLPSRFHIEGYVFWLEYTFSKVLWLRVLLPFNPLLESTGNWKWKTRVAAVCFCFWLKVS